MCHGATNSHFWDATAGEYGGLIQKAWPERKSQIKPWQKHQLSGSFPEKKLKENLQECQEESKTEKIENIYAINAKRLDNNLNEELSKLDIKCKEEDYVNERKLKDKYREEKYIKLLF